MQIRKIEGLEALLQSLSLHESPGKARHIVYPWHEYSKVPEQDICFWYATECCQYQTLRRIILERFQEVGHRITERLADTLILVFIHMPGRGELIGDFEWLMGGFADVDVTQFVFLPTSALLK